LGEAVPSGRRPQCDLRRTKIQPPRPRAAYVERGTLHGGSATRSPTAVSSCCARQRATARRRCLAHEDRVLPALAWLSRRRATIVQRLVECMLAALEPFDPPWRTAPESLLATHRPRLPQGPRVAAEIINALDACEAPHGVIAFDDLHRVADRTSSAFSIS
jgi:LuxR family maltose regulon positive regulatory protein